MRPWTAIGLLAALGLVAVAVVWLRTPGAPDAEPVGAQAAAPDAPAHSDDSLFVYATPERVAAPAPARYAADLPGSVEELEELGGERFPPRAFVHDQLCAADGAMLARLEKAVASAERSSSTSEVAEAYGSLVRYCSQGAVCGEAAKPMPVPPPVTSATSPSNRPALKMESM